MIVGTAQSMHARFNGAEFHKGPMTKSIQEQCGINMTFPGKTEYMDRYVKMFYRKKKSMLFCNENISLTKEKLYLHFGEN